MEYTELLPRGFAVGWDYAIGWLVILPFEITAAGVTIQFWRDDLNIGIWIAVFLTVLSAIQIFGVRGYGEGAVEPTLSICIREIRTNLGQFHSRVCSKYRQGYCSSRFHHPGYCY
jgi:amino acid transporter